MKVETVFLVNKPLEYHIQNDEIKSVSVSVLSAKGTEKKLTFSIFQFISNKIEICCCFFYCCRHLNQTRSNYQRPKMPPASGVIFVLALMKYPMNYITNFE